MDAKHAEVRAGDYLRAHRFGPVVQREVDRGGRAPEHAVEHLGVVTQVAIEGIGHQVVAAPAFADEGAVPVEQDQPLRLPNRKQAKQRLIDEREDRGVGTDAQADGQHRSQGKALVSDKSADGESYFASNIHQHV